MQRAVETIYENGVFKPLDKIHLKEHTRINIIIPSETEQPSQEECTLAGIIDIAKDCPDTDLSIHHDKYLYGER